jgi:hypothetical protein
MIFGVFPLFRFVTDWSLPFAQPLLHSLIKTLLRYLNKFCFSFGSLEHAFEGFA